MKMLEKDAVIQYLLKNLGLEGSLKGSAWNYI